MKLLFVFGLLFVTVFATSTLKSGKLFEPLSDGHVNYINSLSTTWKAGHNFKGLKVEDLKRLCGTILKKKDENNIPDTPGTNINEPPEEFDSRKHWPECADVISHIHDQGSCGSFWAVSAASAITDRVCIASKGKNKTQLSAQELTSCCKDCFFHEGCLGGWPEEAWNFWVNEGLVTGGDYGDNSTCYPYMVEPCEHHTEGSRPKCGEPVDTPKCLKKCVNEKIDYNKDKNFGKSSFSLGNSVAKIKSELLARGPLSTSFLVYDDLFLYKEGVYSVTPGAQELGIHAAVVIGWGKENGVEYWLAKNSWNTNWGTQGYFKIKMGEASINDHFYGGIAKKQA